jgi:Ca2+-binding EF-hand superfamily protein
VIDLFREWDDDCKGFVDQHEFRRAIFALGFAAPSSTSVLQSIDRLFSGFDKDGSGEIKYREFAKAFRPDVITM